MRTVIKWSGSKFPVSNFLHTHEPQEFDVYFEPFLGSGAMLQYRGEKWSVGSDIVQPLISFWQMLRKWPDLVKNRYRFHWENFQEHGHDYYYTARDEFNKDQTQVLLFHFLTRTCMNGLTRFNQKGEFNTAVHLKRPGINPDTMDKIVDAWHPIIQKTYFWCRDYKETLEETKPGDFVFMDPPYQRTKGMYNPEEFDFDEFWSELDKLNSKDVKWMLTLDGVNHKGETYTGPPRDLYINHIETPKSRSPFKKVQGQEQKSLVSDFVYMNYKEEK